MSSSLCSQALRQDWCFGFASAQYQFWVWQPGERVIPRLNFGNTYIYDPSISQLSQYPVISNMYIVVTFVWLYMYIQDSVIHCCHRLWPGPYWIISHPQTSVAKNRKEEKFTRKRTENDIKDWKGCYIRPDSSHPAFNTLLLFLTSHSHCQHKHTTRLRI